MANKSKLNTGRSGTGPAGDTTNEPGQYPVSPQNNIFGGPLPSGTGAPGTAGASGQADATNEPGQIRDGFTGIPDAQIVGSGAPGSQGAASANAFQTGGPDSITYTFPNDGIGPYVRVTANDSVSGSQDSTGANDSGYATGGPQLPGIKGNEPEAGSTRYQTGGGHVMRGGRDIKP